MVKKILDPKLDYLSLRDLTRTRTADYNRDVSHVPTSDLLDFYMPRFENSKHLDELEFWRRHSHNVIVTRRKTEQYAVRYVQMNAALEGTFNSLDAQLSEAYERLRPALLDVQVEQWNKEVTALNEDIRSIVESLGNDVIPIYRKCQQLYQRQHALNSNAPNVDSLRLRGYSVLPKPDYRLPWGVIPEHLDNNSEQAVATAYLIAITSRAITAIGDGDKVNTSKMFTPSPAHVVKR